MAAMISLSFCSSASETKRNRLASSLARLVAHLRKAVSVNRPVYCDRACSSRARMLIVSAGDTPSESRAKVSLVCADR